MSPLLQQLEKIGFLQVSHVEYRHRDGRTIERDNDAGKWIVTPAGNEKKKKPAAFVSLKLAVESVLKGKK